MTKGPDAPGAARLTFAHSISCTVSARRGIAASDRGPGVGLPDEFTSGRRERFPGYAIYDLLAIIGCRNKKTGRLSPRRHGRSLHPPQGRRRRHMRNAVQLLQKLQRDEEGAALVEYTVLLGIMLVAVITTIGLVGGWMSNKWTALWNALSAN